MADLNAGQWALISDGSADTLKRFFQGCREQSVETRGIVVAPPQYRSAIESAVLDWPPGWSVYRSGPLWMRNQQWFGILWADQCPEGPRWDSSLVRQVMPWSVVITNDGSNGDWRRSAIVWGMPCLEAGGSLNLGQMTYDLARWAANTAAAKGICTVDRLVRLPRRDPPAETPPPAVAEAATVKRLQDLMHQHGARVIEPNWTGVSIMISTPSMASRPEALYTMSLLATRNELNSLGVPNNWSLERYNADIGMARSHLVSEFMRTDHTHLLLVDDDMTWEVSALHRLIYANKPFVAVAGPKKFYPLAFAASHVDAAGNPTQLIIDQDTGTAEVTHVGGAFLLLRRDCLETMIAGYPELEYVDGAGNTCWGLFLQQVENRRYLPEDFSFCQRWRRLGGKVYICPDVPLGHIGAHEFKGDLLSNAQRG